MDDFLKLPWRITDPSTLDVGTNFLTDEDVMKSYAYNDNLEAYVPLNIGDNKKPHDYDDPSNDYDIQNKSKQQNKKPQNKDKHLYVTKYPHKSSLNKKQHIQCLQAIKLLEVERPLVQYSQQEQQLINIYNALKLQIHKENTLFLEYVQKFWSKLRSRTCKVLKRNLNFSRNKWKKKMLHVYDYDQFYQEDKVIPLSPIKNKLEFFCDACPLELGNIAKVVLPITEENPMLHSNKLPSVKENGINNEELNITKLSVSQDVYAEHIAKQFDCNIVISSSGLKTIVDNYGPDFRRAWDLPVIVKQYDTQKGARNIIYIDKPLTQPNTTFRELNSMNTKLLLKTNLCVTSQHSFQIPDLVTQQYKTFKSTTANNSLETEVESDTSSDAKRIKLDLTDDQSIDQNDDLQLSENANEDSCDIIDPNLSLEETETAIPLDPKPPHQIRKVSLFHNVCYRIWRLKIKDESNVLLKGVYNSNTEEIKLLVRCKTDGTMEENGILKPVTLVPKLEFQWEHGGEILTHSEILRQWTSLYFRPFSNLIRARILGNNHYYKIESVNLNKIANESIKHYKTSPSTNLGVIYNVFSNLLNTAPGNYILHHNSNQGPFTALMKSIPKSIQQCLNLYELYDKKKFNLRKDMKWNPIDVTLVSSYHERHQITPGIFPPSYENKLFKKNNKSKGMKNSKKT